MMNVEESADVVASMKYHCVMISMSWSIDPARDE
jgi:hypothetical protein